MDHDLLNALVQIEAYLDQGDYCAEVANDIFKTDIVLDYYYYPTHFVDVDDDEKYMIEATLADAGYQDHYEALAELLGKANIAPPPKDELVDGNCYCFMMISFGITPIQPHLKAKKVRYEQVTFFCLPYTDQEGVQRFKVLVVPNTSSNIFVEMKKAQWLAYESEEPLDKTYWWLFRSAIEQVCHGFALKFGEDTSAISGYQPKNLADYAGYLAQFCQLTHIQDVDGFNARWADIQQHLQQYSQQLKDEGGYLNVTPALIQYRFLLSDFLTSCYEDDWQLDDKALEEYLTDHIGQPIKLDDDMDWQPDEIGQKLETESAYCLLNIETGLESYCFLPCLKTQADRILALAAILDFPIRQLGT